MVSLLDGYLEYNAHRSKRKIVLILCVGQQLHRQQVSKRKNPTILEGQSSMRVRGFLVATILYTNHAWHKVSFSLQSKDTK